MKSCRVPLPVFENYTGTIASYCTAQKTIIFFHLSNADISQIAIHENCDLANLPDNSSFEGEDYDVVISEGESAYIDNRKTVKHFVLQLAFLNIPQINLN